MALVTQNFYYFDRETSERLDRIEEKLGTILENQEIFRMAYEDDVARAKAAQDAINAHLDGIKADVVALKDQLAAIPQAGMTPEQAAAMKEIADGLEALAEKAGVLDGMNP